MVESTLKSGSETFSSAIETAHNYTRWVLSSFDRFFGNVILEVGLGHGGYRDFLPHDIHYIGLDIDPDCVARKQKSNPREELLVADVTDRRLVSRLAGKGIDTILCVNVLEHIAEDRLAIEIMLELLPPGGHLLLFSPALPALYSDMDRLAGHVRRYRRSDIEPLVDDQARVVLNHYFNAVGGVGWFINKAFRHNNLNSERINTQIKAFDRFLVPIARALDPPFRRVFGQSVVAVFRKT